uniref:C2H2-type domain-containing protein n=1 Tax=Sphaeramia orbicularis TaxID=375764 RepID=A0A673C695_9TELE
MFDIFCLLFILNHQRLHAEVRPFGCDQCGKTFYRAHGLKMHQMVHTGERKPFRCETCGKSFNQADTLKGHQRIHTGERPFSCDTYKNIHHQPKPSTDVKCLIPVHPLILSIHVNNGCKIQFVIFSWSSDMTHLDVQRLRSYRGNTIIFYNIDSPVKPMELDQ